jgi:seryl-tRNA synthetase
MNTLACDQFRELVGQLVQVCPETETHDSETTVNEVSALVAWLDQTFESMALEAGAIPIEGSDRIEKSVLEAAGFFESFSEEKLIDVRDGQTRTPAVCYQCYPRLSDQEIDELNLWTCAAKCGRNEGCPELGRFQTFHMREIVLIGSAHQVREERERWMNKISEFARALGLQVDLRPAADCFFASEAGRGQKLLQQIKGLKFELQLGADGPGRNMAIASFNLHETFFASRFRMKLRDGSDAYSGCVAFGLERWALALALQLGPAQAFALAREKAA